MSPVVLGTQDFVYPTTGKPISLGYVYIGTVDTDPTVALNQKSVTLLQEDGVEVAASQPISLSAGGVPTYNGSPVQVLVDGDFSLLVQDANTTQVYYVPSNASVTDGTLRTDLASTTYGVDLVANALKVFSLDDYGAAGDGVTSDVTAIKAAIAAAWAAQGGAIAGSPGKRYLIDSDIEIPHLVSVEGNGMTWLLSGAGTTLSFPQSSTDHPSLNATNYPQAANYYAFARNFIVDAQDTATLPLYIGRVVLRDFANIHVLDNAGNGITIDGAQNSRFSNLTATKGTNGFHLSNGVNGNTFSGLLAFNTANAFILVDQDATLPQYGLLTDTGASNNTFYDCIFESNNATEPDYAAYFDDARQNQFVNCSFNNCTVAHVYLGPRSFGNLFDRMQTNSGGDAGLTAVVINKGYANNFRGADFVQLAGAYKLFDVYNLTIIDAHIAGGLVNTAPTRIAQNLTKVLTVTSGNIEPVIGETVTGGTSGATAILAGFVEDSGTWAAGNWAGDLVIVSQTGTFQAESLTIGDTTTATAGADSATGDLGAFVRFTGAMGGGAEAYKPFYTGSAIQIPWWNTTEKRLEYWDGTGWRGANGDDTAEVLSTLAPAASLYVLESRLSGASNNVAATLADGTYVGQRKLFFCTSAANTVTVAAGTNKFVYDNAGTPTRATTATFTAQYAALVLEWSGASQWVVVSAIGITWA